MSDESDPNYMPAINTSLTFSWYYYIWAQQESYEQPVSAPARAAIAAFGAARIWGGAARTRARFELRLFCSVAGAGAYKHHGANIL